jgi:hypothetical protein
MLPGALLPPDGPFVYLESCHDSLAGQPKAIKVITQVTKSTEW